MDESGDIRLGFKIGRNTELEDWIRAFPKKTKADQFAEWVKEHHRVPNVCNEVDVFKSFGATEFTFKLSTGYYKLWLVDFEDSSTWIEGMAI